MHRGCNAEFVGLRTRPPTHMAENARVLLRLPQVRRGKGTHTPHNPHGPTPYSPWALQQQQRRRCLSLPCHPSRSRDGNRPSALGCKGCRHHTLDRLLMECKQQEQPSGSNYGRCDRERTCNKQTSVQKIHTKPHTLTPLQGRYPPQMPSVQAISISL
jgi:hypothetical protein